MTLRPAVRRGVSCGKGYHGPAVDAWALGVLTYVVLCARFPFGATQAKILQGKYERVPLESCTSDARHVVKELLVVDPNSEVGHADPIKHVDPIKPI